MAWEENTYQACLFDSPENNKGKNFVPFLPRDLTKGRFLPYGMRTPFQTYFKSAPKSLIAAVQFIDHSDKIEVLFMATRPGWKKQELMSALLYAIKLEFKKPVEFWEPTEAGKKFMTKYKKKNPNKNASSDLSKKDLRHFVEKYQLQRFLDRPYEWLEKTILRIGEYSQESGEYEFNSDELEQVILDKIKHQKEYNENNLYLQYALEDEIKRLLSKQGFSYRERSYQGLVSLSDYLTTKFGTIRISDHKQKKGGGFNLGTGKQNGEAELSVIFDDKGNVSVEKWRPDLTDLTSEEREKLDDLLEYIVDINLTKKKNPQQHKLNPEGRLTRRQQEYIKLLEIIAKENKGENIMLLKEQGGILFGFQFESDAQAEEFFKFVKLSRRLRDVDRIEKVVFLVMPFDVEI